MSDTAATEPPALATPAGRPRRRLAVLWESRWLGVAFIAALLVLWEIAAASGVMPAALSLETSSRNSSHVFGGASMPAFLKSALLYQKPTIPRLYGMPYCLPLTCQPAAEPPMLLIQGATWLVMFMTLPALTWSASWPPPHCW